jgi:hypothetical protein
MEQESNKLPRNIRRSIEKINKDMTPEMRKSIADKAKAADDARLKATEYHMETQNYISSHGQFLTTIMNGTISHHGSYTMDSFNADSDLALEMAELYVQNINAYKTNREKQFSEENEDV